MSTNEIKDNIVILKNIHTNFTEEWIMAVKKATVDATMAKVEAAKAAAPAKEEAKKAAAPAKKAPAKKAAPAKATAPKAVKLFVEYQGGQVSTQDIAANAAEASGKKTIKEWKEYYQP